MSKIAFKPNESGTATFTIEAPATNTDRIFELPDEAGKVLTSASNLAGVTGVGKVLQVVRATDSTSRVTTSTSFVDASISVTITPTSATSVVVLVWSFYANTSNVGRTIFAQITDSSDVALSGAEEMRFVVASDILNTSATLFAYASPETTSAVTYKGRFAATGSAITLNNDRNTGQLYAIEVAA